MSCRVIGITKYLLEDMHVSHIRHRKQMKQKTKCKEECKEERITTNYIAEYCLVSSNTVRRWIRDGKLSAVKLPSGHYRITTAGFRDFLERYDIPVKEALLSPNIEYGRKEET